MAAIRGAIQKAFSFASFKLGLSSLGREQRDASRPHSAMTDNVFASILSPFEAYVVSLQSLLIWERPYLSAVALVAVNCLFWLIVSCRRQFYSFLAILCIISFLYKTWVTLIWPEIRVPPPEGEDTEEWTPVHPQVLSVPELSRYLKDLWEKVQRWWRGLWRLRSTHHGLFTLLTCAALSILAVIGHWIPGVVIVYTIVMIISLGPGIVLYIIPSSFYDHIEGFFVSSDIQSSTEQTTKTLQTSLDSDSDLEEFLPEPTNDMLRQLSLRGQEEMDAAIASEDNTQDLSSNKASKESVVLSELGMENFVNEEEEKVLYEGLEGFPTLDNEEESDIDAEENDILAEAMPAQLESNGTQEQNTIHFVPTHFREESSESENESFTHGLSFGDIAENNTPSDDFALNDNDIETNGEFDEASNTNECQRNSDTGTTIRLPSSTHPLSQSSDIDINEYEIVSESDLSS